MSLLHCSLRARTVAFENNLTDKKHQLSIGNGCFTSLYYASIQHGKIVGLSENPLRSLLPGKRETSLFSERCPMSLMTHDENVYETYVTTGFLVIDIPLIWYACET